MNAATVSQRGQVVIPVEVRRAAGIQPGDKIRFEVDEHGEGRFRRVETLDELGKRLNAMFRGDVEPLLDPRAFYNTREPRI